MWPIFAIRPFSCLGSNWAAWSALAGLLFVSSLEAKTHRISWEASATEGVIGYRVYVRESGRSSVQSVDAGIDCTKAVDLIPGRTYLISATSVTVDGLEGPPGETITYRSPPDLDSPAILVQPQSVSASKGGNVVLTVTAAGAEPLRYQWSFNDVPMPGQTSRALPLNQLQAAKQGAYQVMISNDRGSVKSAVAFLSVLESPVIVRGPQSLSVPQRTSVVLRVKAEGEGPLAYQWLKDGIPVDGNSSNLVLSTLQTNVAGVYQVRVSNRLGSVTSSNATLWVKAPPAVVMPNPATVDEGKPFSVRPVFQGWQPMTFQWSKDGRALPNETNAVLSVNNAQEGAGGVYTVSATNIDGTGRSAGYPVTIYTTPRLTSLPVSQVGTNGKSVAFSAIARGGATLAFQWFFEGAPIPKAITPRLSIPTVQLTDEGAYVLTVSNRLGWTSTPPVTLRISSPPAIKIQPVPVTLSQGKSASFSVSATGRSPMAFAWSRNGQAIQDATNDVFTIPSAQSTDAGNYQVTVTNSDGSRSSQVALLRVISFPVITEQPADVTLDRGSILTLRTTVSSEVLCQYQWSQNGVPIPSANKPVLTLNAVQGIHTGGYQLTISNFTGVVRSRVAQVTVTDPAASKATSTAGIQAGSESPRLETVRDKAGRTNLVVKGEPGQRYEIEATSDLQTWESLGDMTLVDGVSRFVDLDDATRPIRIYRFRLKDASLLGSDGNRSEIEDK